MNYFDEIFDRLKKELRCNTDKEMYEFMGVMQGTFTNWRRRNSIPYEQINSICINKKLDLNYIINGKKDKKTEKNENLITKKEKEIIKKLKKLNPIQQEIILNKIEGEIMKNNEKEIEKLKEKILSYYPNICSTHEIKMEEFEEIDSEDDKIWKNVYIHDDWDSELAIKTNQQSTEKDFKELLEDLLKYTIEKNKE